MGSERVAKGALRDLRCRRTALSFSAVTDADALFEERTAMRELADPPRNGSLLAFFR